MQREQAQSPDDRMKSNSRRSWTRRTRAVALAGLLGSILASCDSEEDSGQDGCEPQLTRTCVGPGACEGGQVCGADRKWSACDCGTAGSGGTGGTPATGGNAGSATGGSAGSTGGSGTGGSTGGTGGTTGGATGGAGGVGTGGSAAVWLELKNVTPYTHDFELDAGYLYVPANGINGVLRIDKADKSVKLIGPPSVCSSLALTPSAVVAACGAGIVSFPVSGDFYKNLTFVAATHVAVDASHAYFVSGGSLKKVPLEGGPQVTLLNDFSTTSGIAVDASSVYVIGSYSSPPVPGVYKVPLEGNAVTSIAVEPNATTGDVIADGPTVFFGGAAGLKSVPAAGGTVTTLVASPAHRVSTDGAALYYGALSPAVIYKLPKAGGASQALGSVPFVLALRADAASTWVLGYSSDTKTTGMYELPK